MPKQHTLFGRPIRMAPRRIPFLFVGIGIFAIFTLFFLLPSTIPTGPSLSQSLADHKISVPKFKVPFSSSILNPFRPAAHAPPVQKNSTDGESSWYSNWNWLSPFSSSVTLDENRSLLPPLRKRPPIYCYYDTTIKREQATKTAESDLLLTWRRAWWAQGFKPVILSEAEAMNNPFYDRLQRLEMEPRVKTDIMRWLAWENMGGGLLAQHLLFPMGAYQDPLLAYLRRGEYPRLTRWEGMEDGLFAGSKSEITGAINQALTLLEKSGSAKNFVDAVASDVFQVDPTHDGLAYYSASIIEKKYGRVGEQLEKDRVAGLLSLNALVNAHLHVTWQDLFPRGMAVLKPLPQHTTHLIEPALLLAQRLSKCPDSPVPASCPPNNPKCSPCVASHPMKIATPGRFRNVTGLYTIGTVPHPYTRACLNSLKDDVDIPWIRRQMQRDLWLGDLTQELLGTGVSGSARVVTFKDAVAGEYATSHSVWLTAEQRELPSDLDWYLGFQIPSNEIDDGRSETPVPGPERRPKPEHDPADGPLPTDKDFAREPELLKKALAVETSKRPQDVSVRNAIEAWNLADTEAWKFAKAFFARSRVERMKWDEEESEYAGGIGREADAGRRKWSHWE